MGKIAALVKHIRCRGPESAVPLHWVFPHRQPSRPAIRQICQYDLHTCGEYTRIDYRGQTFLWPRKSKTDTLLMLTSELMTPNHPHQYLYGPTQLCPDDVVLDIGACEGDLSICDLRGKARDRHRTLTMDVFDD